MVIAREDRPGEPRLVGYVTGTAEPAAVRAALAERLPAYMVPSAVVALTALPLTVNGKLDKRALPVPEYEDTDRYRAPSTPAEEILADHLRPSARAASGSGSTTHSSIWVAIRCRRCAWSPRSTPAWMAALQVRAVFEAPTVAQLALRIGGDDGRLPRMVAGQRPAVVPLSFAQNRLWFIDQLQGPSPVYNLAVALRLRGQLDADALGAALADVVGRHESLRTLFPAVEGIPQQCVIQRERADFGWQVVDATRVADQPAGGGRRRDGATHVRSGCRDPFAGKAFPGRRRRACVGGGVAPYRRRRLVGRPAECVIWGWPMPAAVQDRPPAGPNYRCSTSITRCGSTRSSVISTTATAASPRSWPTGRTALAGMPERVALPTDRPYPAVADHRGARLAVDWPAELQQQVARVAREHNATSFMVIQAALAVLLAKLSASSDVAVGFSTAGRRDPALDELVGCFVNYLVLRVEVAGDPTVAELLAQVRQRSLAAYEHQDVPFEVHRRAAQPHPKPDPSPAGPGGDGLAELPRTRHQSRRRVGVGGPARHPAAGANPHRPNGFDVLAG